MNDLEMMEKVNISVAMDNGAEAIKKISTMVTDSVEEDGLAKDFEKLGLC
jgi:hydroxymethylpyrimidine pyrophosphatase-like HAD family hydrolase